MNQPNQWVSKRVHSLIYFAKYFYIFLLVCSASLISCSKVSDKAPSVSNTPLSDKKAKPVKPFLAGLVTMGLTAFHDIPGGQPTFSLTDIMLHPGVFKGAVINLTWSELEPVQGQLNTKFLDSCLTLIKNYNTSNPQTTIAAKLRISPGFSAPLWAQQLGGTPVTIIYTDTENDSTYSGTIGRWWTTAYRNGWTAFLNLLGKKYDSNPLILEICNTSGSSLTDEPYLIPTNANSVAALLAAGYTDAQEEAMLSGSINDYAGWPTTRLDWTFNEFRQIDPNTPPVLDSFAPEQELNWRTALGTRGILANHALDTTIAPGLQYIYNEFEVLGPPLTFQTKSPGDVNDNITINKGISYGATQIELWASTQAGGFATYPSTTTLNSWSTQLLANATKAGL